MPYESLTCPKCGSGDCQEVKPGTHFCNHCDNVFRYVPPAVAGGGVAACASCGVIAVGLCLICNRHFCRGHQAAEPNTRYFDQCAACFAERTTQQQARLQQELEEAEERSRRFGRIYLAQSARSELLAARVPIVRLFHVSPREVHHFRKPSTIEDFNWGQVGHGWLLGEFNWHSARTGSLKSQTVLFAECTGLPKLHYRPRDFSAFERRDTQAPMFGRVTGPTADGGYGIPIDPGKLLAFDEDLGEAVQRLAGTTRKHR